MNDPLQQLRAALASDGGAPVSELPSEPTFQYAVSRFALARALSKKFGPDEIVLLRQALRWSGQPHLLVGPPDLAHSGMRGWLQKAGIEWSSDGHLSAVPYTPSWLNDSTWTDHPPRKRTLPESFPAEPYLKTLGYDSWRSPAQKQAAFSVLRMPPGKTGVVVLPTGAGKSLCFQLLPRFSAGLTLVVVPTVALAIDQHAAAVKRLANLPGANPCYFAAGDSSEDVLQQVRERRTRLLFASPEACVSGRLRPLLDKFAKEGWLENLVIDEAHVIWTWGAEFRVEFQILAAIRRRWLAASQNRLRTFLFSATMAPDCRTALTKMFSEQGNSQEFVSQRLRPEIQYSWHPFYDSKQRDPAVVEALWRLPRPLILYVTEVKEAAHFSALLRAEGFSRFGCFTGETAGADRDVLLQRWKSNDLDLMVATSAFGLGVDKPDVRTVIHACHPENLDRFYQEVGRGGRDGWSSHSIALPTKRDRFIAEILATRLMTIEMIQERWHAMFSAGEPTEQQGLYALPVNARRTGLIGTSTYSENVRWNKRLLVQLNRANLLDFSDLALRDAKDRPGELEEVATVRVKFPPYTQELGERMKPIRIEELRQFRAGRIALDHLLASEACASRSLSTLYGIESTQRVCGGCPWCRANGRNAGPCPPLEYSTSATPVLSDNCDVVENCPSPFDPRQKAAFVDLLHKCVVRKRLFQFFCAKKAHSRILDGFKQAVPPASQSLYRLDTFDDLMSLTSVESVPALLYFANDDLVTFESHPRGIHFLCGVPNPHDSEGRHITVRVPNSRRWASTEPWLLESPISSQ